MALLDIGIVRSVDRTEGAFAPDSTLKFFSRFLMERFFDRIGASTQKEGANGGKSDGEGLQARRILKKVTCDK